MKKILFILVLMMACISGYSQGTTLGFEGLIVEKWDASAAMPGATAYRVFVDMAEGWQMQGAYGDNQNTLFFETTTVFYNHPDGVSSGRGLPNFVLADPAGRFDSYVTVDGVTTTRVGVLRSEDTDGSVDGFMTGTSLALQTVGADFDVPFGAANWGTRFAVTGGAYNVNGGEMGLTSTNRVMIGQFTTDGNFSFELNIQMRNQTLGMTEKYIARAPIGDNLEVIDSRLIYTSVVIAPTVSITAPSNGASYLTGNVVNIQATAGDANGTVTKVEFFRNGLKIGEDLNGTDGFSYSWTSVAGAAALTAVATDNDNNPTTSAVVNISVTDPVVVFPTVSVTAPVNNATLYLSQPFTLTATAADADGSVTQVEFFVNGGSVGVDNSGPAPFTFSWTPTAAGPVSITARATDNGSNSTTSDAVSAYVQDPSSAYEITTSTNLCTSSDVFCVPVVATQALSRVLGFDMVLEYDSALVRPTGVVYVSEGSLIANEDWTSTSVNITDADSMFISVFLNGSAPIGTTFNNTGRLMCVEFVKTARFQSVDTAEFVIDNIYESYATQVIPRAVTDGLYISTRDLNFYGSLLFWKDNSPIAYNSSMPSQYAITDVFGSTNCLNKFGPAVQPNLTGNFAYNTALGSRIKIERDIVATTDVQDVVNGADAQLVARVIVNDASFKPSVFQMIAMDVNRDGKVSAGDLSQINLRAVLKLGEFQQKWNYNDAGTKINAGASEDWVFIPSQTLLLDKTYRISAEYPLTDSDNGFTRYGLPIIDTCHQIDISAGSCPIIKSESYQAVMLGDVNGSYAALPVSSLLKSTESNNAVIFDLSNTRFVDGYAEVPVYFASEENVNSLDFSMQFNEENLSLNSVIENTEHIESVSYFNTNDRTLRFTSYSLKNYEAGKTIASVRFAMNTSAVNKNDFSSLAAYVNGQPAKVLMSGTDEKLIDMASVNIYPNPANDLINVEVSVDARIVLMDLSGRNILFETKARANQKEEINISNIADGIYIIKVSNNDFSEVKKVIIRK